MGTIYKRKGNNGRKTQLNWVAQTTTDGRRRSRSFREKAEAKSWLARIEAGLPSHELTGIRSMVKGPADSGGTISVAQSLGLYAEAAPRHLSPLTWQSCQAPIVAYWLRQPIAERAINNLYRSDIKEWIARCRAENRPSGTIRKRLNVG